MKSIKSVKWHVQGPRECQNHCTRDGSPGVEEYHKTRLNYYVRYLRVGARRMLRGVACQVRRGSSPHFNSRQSLSACPSFPSKYRISKDLSWSIFPTTENPCSVKETLLCESLTKCCRVSIWVGCHLYLWTRFRFRIGNQKGGEWGSEALGLPYHYEISAVESLPSMAGVCMDNTACAAPPA